MSGPRSALQVAALTTFAVVLAGCGDLDPSAGGVPAGSGETAEGEKGTVNVGLLNPTTGPFTALGEDVNAGFELYLERNGGTLGGYGVEVVKEDTANDPGGTTTKARQLVEQHESDIIIGLVNSGVAYAVAPYLEEAGVPLLITVAGADGLTRETDPNVFRLSYTGSQDTMPAGDYVCDELGHRTAAIVGLDYSFGWEATGGFARVYEDAGCEVVQELYAPLGTQDWGPYVTQIDPAADVVFAVAPGSDSVRFFQAIDGFGVTTPVFVHGSTTDETLLPSLGATAEGVQSSLHYAPGVENDANDTFVAAWTEAQGRSTNQYAEDGWAAAQSLEAALTEMEGEATPEAIREALAGVQIDAPRGPVYFDEYGQAVYDVQFREVTQQDGEWVNEVIDTAEDVSQFYTYDPAEYLEFPPYEELKGTWAD
ncbi:ABC transporter substrate-binding protein [Modestobacter sp. VKM Ac-2985]|uniref:ABC transporter substrate-binding protein n=1 Tax=Modestobacter sp. VKM Ac-2985 TaxID=3004139 RepID=UPI0022AB923B|nr:ABC transporter substrate-binding protein [Modestobacter sp. VKM Ac-2985]MCZ2837319.1 ABC transporter substrate-binding protein [Modestobacter sp. VKM Ac-2985]